jgi:drug/metabolite transporter (DMT)-like permease
VGATGRIAWIIVLLVIGLSLLAAFLFALSASLQQHEAHGVDPDPMVLARVLARSRLWRLGWIVNLAGFVVQGTALYLGSVALVQPLLVTQLIFALPLTTWWVRQWPSPQAWLSGATICVGLALFITAHGGSTWQGEPDRPRLAIAGFGTVLAVAALVRLSVRQRPFTRAVLLASGAGLCFSVSAALMKLTAEDLTVRGVAATAVDWPGYTLAVSSLTGFVLGQLAFATGSLPTAVATMTITNPVASYAIGVLAFHVALPATPAGVAAVLASGALVSAGVVGLANSPMAQPTLRPA